MKIKLNKGLYATVDAKDYQLCMGGLQWYAWASKRRDGSIRTYYAARNIVKPNGARTVQLMHRLILKLTDAKIQADHWDGNGLNNRRKNLKKATNLQNGRKVRAYPSSTSGVAGVYRDMKNKKWVAEIIIYGQYKFLGRFKTLLAAKRARKAAERYIQCSRRRSQR